VIEYNHRAAWGFDHGIEAPAVFVSTHPTRPIHTLMNHLFAQAVFAAFENKLAAPGKQEENEWSREIAERFAELAPGSSWTVNKQYPGRTERYDIMLRTATGETLYAENKGAWLSYWLDVSNVTKFNLYLMGSLCGMPRSDKSAALDIGRLAEFSPESCGWAALIVFGSHRAEHDVAAKLNEFARLADLNRAPWTSHRREVANRWFPGYSYDVRVWTCRRRDLRSYWLARQDQAAHA
jgi:hypothetical protein